MSTELFDFGLSFFEPFPSKKQSLTQDEYNSGYVDFYSQSLGETTGINVVMPKYEDKTVVKK